MDLIEPHLPQPERRRVSKKGGRPFVPARKIMNGVLWILRTGAPWSDLPLRYGAYQTCHRRFQQWCESGVLMKVLTALRQHLKEFGFDDLEREMSIDGTYVGARKGDL